MSSPDTVLTGKQDRYRVDRELGRGGFGVTHLARRERDGAQVVIKRLRMDRLDDWKAFDLFEREARVLRALRHPNIPAFVDHFELQEGGKLRGFALVQEYVEGRTLRELQGKLDAAALRGCLTRLLEVCRYLHAQDPPVIHRDINPKNVLVRESGEPVLIDFGTVQNALRSADTVSSTSAGTFGYAPSEQLIGRAVPASDLFGLAMTYLAVASGREPEAMPFAGNRVQVSEVLRGHDAHPRLKLLLEEMTDPDAARRPASAGDVLARMQGIPTTAAASSSPAVALVPATDDDPAARAERTWRARAERARAVGAGAARPGQVPDTERINAASFDETGAHALLSFGTMVFTGPPVARLELATLAVRALEVEGTPGHPHVQLAADGRSALFTSFDDSLLVTCQPDGSSRAHKLIGVPWQGLVGGGVGAYAISPDHAQLAVFERKLALFDLARGTVAQTIEPQVRHWGRSQVRFVPDGSAILIDQVADRCLVDPSGETVKVEWDAHAFASDGHAVAIAEDGKVSVGVAERFVPLRWRVAPKTIWKSAEDVRRLRYSPDDRLLAVTLRSDRIVVIDAATGAELLKIDDPHRPGAGFRNLHDVGFSADGRRVLVAGSCTVHPLATDREDAIAVYSLTQRRPLGTIRRRGDEGLALYAFTPFGVHGPLDRDPVKRILLDEPVADVLGNGAASGLDFADRVDHWGALVGAGRLPADLDLAPLVEASAGLTHLLPIAVERVATPPAAAAPRFGQSAGAGATLPVPALLDQLRWLAGKGPDEQDALFEPMLAAEIAREVAAQPKPAAGARGSRFWLAVALVALVALAAAAALAGR